MANIKGRRTFLLRSGLWVTTGLITAGTGLRSAHAQGPRVTFREGGNATQDVVGVFTTSYKGRLWPNDEARSCVLENLDEKTFIRVYDSPRGSTSDDWTEIKVAKKFTGRVVIPSFEQGGFYGPNNSVEVFTHPDNGLDGKVSYVDIFI